MGRTVIAEDGIETYVASLASKKATVVGLLFGQEISAQKSCVIHLARTPDPAIEDEEEESESSLEIQNKNVRKVNSPTEDFDDSLVLDHARQVMRSLPGGITILGVFIVSNTDPFQNPAMNNRIRKLLTSIDVIIGKSSITVRQQLTCERIALHISNTTIKYTCKTLEIDSPLASPKPADWKFVNAAGSPWIELHCTTNVEFFIGLSDSESSGTLRQQLETGIDLYGKAVKQCICLFGGKFSTDLELVDDASTVMGTGKKKSKQQNSEERMKTINVQILIPELEVKQEKQECSSELRFGGQMCIKAYIHGKATVREASQVIREDILRSLWARCDMHCDSLIGEEQRGQPDEVKAVLHEPPRRVLAPLPFSPISVSDYLFPGEGPADSLTSLADLLDLGTLLDGDVQDYWEAAAEVNDAELQIQSDSTLLETTISKQNSVAPSTNSRAILLSGLIALLAIVLSYLTLQIFRTN
ncbi:protein odr-4 homolog isoform X1 [Daphnia magna]|uniref:protein odr-4 homolog isoform X1 n=1 Tax=Daphnia magna TaxID=35525 RepID=UPI001E1BC306|nr:protein odr-4 homolog isoform X1 [Daphnia magna]